MGKFLSLIPKNLLAFGAIVGGIAFIVLAQPPHSVCDSQLDLINDLQRRFLYKDPKSKKMTRTKYQNLREECKITNDPGGCYELFQELKVMLHDLGTLSKACGPVVGEVTEFKKALWDSLEMLVRLAWGEAPPASYTAKFHWLDTADISLFCKLKAQVIAFYGDKAYEDFRVRIGHELPGADNLNSTQIWDLSIFSENCARYP